MKVNFYVVACAVLVALGVCNGASVGPLMEGENYNVNEVCSLVAIDSKVASLESCSKYYVCQKSGPVAQTCKSGKSFDLTTQECVKEASALCAVNAKYANACANVKTTTFIANPIVCGNWLYCANSKVTGQGACAGGQTFDNTKEKCSYEVDCAAATEFSVCDVVEPNVYFGNTDDCSSWQICRANGSLEAGKCNNSLVFNVDRKMCVNTSSKPETDCSRVQE